MKRRENSGGGRIKRNTLYRFVGLEETGVLTVDPRALREEYLQAMKRFLRDLRRSCMKERIDYQLIDTGTSLELQLSTVLALRSQRKARR